MKNKFKLLLFILIVPFMCINVDAKEITQEEYMNVFANSVQKQINLDKTFAYYLDNSYERDIAMQEKADDVLASMNTYMTENELEYSAESVAVQFNRDTPEYTRYVCSLVVDGSTVRLVYGDVTYKDYENYSDEDNELIESIFTNTSLRYSYELSFEEMSLLNSKWDLIARNPFYEELDELIEGTGITYKHTNETYSRFSPTSGYVSATVYLFKNDVYYKTIYLSKLWEVTINIPDEVEKTVDEYSNYAANELKENAGIYPESTVELIQPTPSEMVPAHEYQLLIDEMYYGNIPVVNNDKVLLADNFQVDLSTSNEYTYASVVTDENKTTNYTNMVNYLNDNGYNHIIYAYNIVGNNTRRAYFYFDNAYNGKTLKILGIDNGVYTEQDAIVENGMIIINILMNEELIIAEKQEVENPTTTTVTFDDISNKISGYYSSNYTENEINNIKNEIESTIKQEITNAGIDYEKEGYTVSLENENGWYVKITNNKNQTYTRTIYITPKKTVVEEPVTPTTVNPTPVTPQQPTNNAPVVPATRRNNNYKPANNTNTEAVQEQQEKQEETVKEDNELKTLEETIKEKESTQKKEQPAKDTIKEDSKKTTEAKKVNTLPIKIIIGSVILLIIGGGVIYVRSRYY